tara:strand:- start:56 stop:427 length:372 start_codon:yes stop_codon:yes gene_type:complete
MSFEVQSERIAAVPGGAELLVQLINLSLDAPNESDFLATALDLFRKTVNSKGVVLVRGVKGQWRIIANSGSGDSLPVELLSETLDSEKCQQSEVGPPLRFLGPILRESWLLAMLRLTLIFLMR